MKTSKILIIVMLLSVTLSFQNPSIQPKSISKDSNFSKVNDSLMKREVNMLKPKVESLSLIDTIRAYTNKVDSGSIKGRSNILLIKKQQNQIREQLLVIEKHNNH